MARNRKGGDPAAAKYQSSFRNTVVKPPQASAPADAAPADEHKPEPDAAEPKPRARSKSTKKR